MEDEYGRPWPHHVPDTNGPCVAYDAHVAAIAAARRENAYLPTVKAEFDRGYLQGERDGLIAARDAVDDAEILSAWKAVALAAIDGVKP